jgi:hypothetical protein
MTGGSGQGGGSGFPQSASGDGYMGGGSANVSSNITGSLTTYGVAETYPGSYNNHVYDATKNSYVANHGLTILSIPTAIYSGSVTGSPTVTTTGTNTILVYTQNGTYTAQ